MKFHSNSIKKIFIAITLIFSSITLVHAQKTTQGFISDNLPLFMHAGPGTNYRILGTINAGTQIKITGKSDKGYSEIIDNKNRITWIETQYLSTKPGLPFIVAELNKKVTQANDYTNQLDGEVNELKSTIELLNQDKVQLQQQLSKVQRQLKETSAKVKDQDTNIKKQWFFNGAIVLGIGLILGLILPRFFARRRISNSMDNWG